MPGIISMIFGAILVVWGIYRMKNDDALFGKTQKGKNIFNLIIFGEASGIGQFAGGVIMIIIGIAYFIIK